jgi:hypothetical protein
MTETSDICNCWVSILLWEHSQSSHSYCFHALSDLPILSLISKVSQDSSKEKLFLSLNRTTPAIRSISVLFSMYKTNIAIKMITGSVSLTQGTKSCRRAWHHIES